MMNEKSETNHPGIILALDTATSAMSVAIVNRGRVLAENSSVVERNHSVYLTPAIENVLSGLGLGPRNIQGIAVGCGPGSYTGVRIGITVAKTMSWALKTPVVGVSSLEAMAAGALKAWVGGGARQEEQGADAEEASSPVDEGTYRHLKIPSSNIWIIPLLNARRGQAFTALFALKQAQTPEQAGTEADQPLMWPVAEEGWQRLQEDRIRLMDSWIDELLEQARREEQPPDAILFTGEIKEFTDKISRFEQEAHWGAEPARTASLAYDIQAEFIGYLGALRLARGDHDVTHNLLPNYTQLPEAEVNLAARNKLSEQS